MSSEISPVTPVLCTLRFRHAELERRLSAEIYVPQPFVTHPLGAPAPVTDWGCKVVITVEGSMSVKTVYSVSWLASFLLALEFIRKLIPEGEEREWLDEEGVESWCVLPRTIPFSWGYELYDRISRMSGEMERVFVEDVERRRLAWEMRRGIKDE